MRVPDSKMNKTIAKGALSGLGDATFPSPRPSPSGRYVFTVAAGILPAVEPGILPGGNRVLSEKTLAIWRLRPGGKMPPAAAAKLAAVTHLLATVNTYAVRNGNPVSPFPLPTSAS